MIYISRWFHIYRYGSWWKSKARVKVFSSCIFFTELELPFPCLGISRFKKRVRKSSELPFYVMLLFPKSLRHISRSCLHEIIFNKSGFVLLYFESGKIGWEKMIDFVFHRENIWNNLTITIFSTAMLFEKLHHNIITF